MTTIHYTNTEKTVMVLIDSRPRVLSLDTQQGKELLVALKRKPQDPDEIRRLSDVQNYIARKTLGRVVIDDRDQVRLDGVVVDYGMANIIINLFQTQGDIDNLVKFLENVADNPNTGIANDIYEFISKGLLPITEDGHFLAFKRVRDDYFDLHSGTVNYAVGQKPSLDRAVCDADRNRTCSSGLHACSYDYLPHFHNSSGKIMIVKINPRDVTAIPTDYNLTKLRCCLMEVIGEVPEAESKAYFSKGNTVRDTENFGDGDQAVEGEEAQNKSYSIEDARYYGAEDGRDAAYAEAEVQCNISGGEYYEEVIGQYGISYPLAFVDEYLSIRELDEYHSEAAYKQGRDDAERFFQTTTDVSVEDAFDFTNGERHEHIPYDHEDTYALGYLERMLELQLQAHPDA